MLLVIDNYDSFTFNLVQYLAQLGADVTVVRNDAVTPADALSYDGVLLSPGPGTPADAGACIPIVRECAGKTPIFGVCLGHQAIAEATGRRSAKHRSFCTEKPRRWCTTVTECSQDYRTHSPPLGITHWPWTPPPFQTFWKSPEQQNPV